jgi:hypothetical protein
MFFDDPTDRTLTGPKEERQLQENKRRVCTGSFAKINTSLASASIIFDNF